MSFVVLRSDLESILLDIQHMEALNASYAAFTATNGRAPTLEEKRALEVALLGPGAAQQTAGLRTVSGILNNLNPGHAAYGSADRAFPTATTPVVTTAPAASFDTNGPAAGGVVSNTTYTPGQSVVDAQVRQISNLIADQTSANPAAVAASRASGGVVEMYHGDISLSTDLGGGLFRGTTGSLHNANGELVDEVGNPIYLVPNQAPAPGAAPYNGWLALFGQGFDHGLDFINKGGNGTVYIPLQPGDPLYQAGSPTNFMVVTRAAAGAVNRTTPWIDMNQAYASHPAFQVFLREYVLDGNGSPVATGKLLAGATGGMPTWAEIKAQARNLLGINLTDAWVGDCPLLATDDFGAFIPGANGMPMVVFNDPTAPGGFRQVEGDIRRPISLTRFGGAVATGHAFLLDIAHTADPSGGKTADTDSLLGNAQPVNNQGRATTYDNELLDKHFIAGDGRVNENSGLTTFHLIFHNEHDRLVSDYKRLAIQDAVANNNVAFLNEWVLGFGGEAADLTLAQAQAINTAAQALLTATSTEEQVLAAYEQAASAAGVLWDGNRLFQAARYVNEMEYQHSVLQEFARFMDPNIAGAPGVNTDLDPAILSEFASAVYRFGHSMLNETVDRITLDAAGTWVDNTTSLIEAFINPIGFLRVNTDTLVPELTPEQAGGEVLRGMTRQTGNAIDEFVTGALRNNLVGLPLDLAATNIARGRDVGIPRFNEVRRQLGLAEYGSWSEFAANLKHAESSINFIAAYGTHALITAATNMAGKRAAATALIMGTTEYYVDDQGVTQEVTADFADAQAFLGGTGAYAANKGGLEAVDLWIAGLAEKTQAGVNMLGETFGVIFRTQIQQLQDADRFYYLRRLNGNLLAQIEQNSLTSMALRNVDVTSLPGNIFGVPTYTLEVDKTKQYTGLGTDLKADPLGRTGLVPLVNRSMSSTVAGVNSTANVLFFNGTADQHAVLNGTAASDVIAAGDGDDTIFGNGGRDFLRTGAGADFAYGGDGDDILWDGGSGPAVGDVLHGDGGNDVINMATGFVIAHGGNGKDFVNGANRDNLSEVFLNAGDDFLYAGTGGTAAQGGVGDDWMEGTAGSDKVSGEDLRGLIINPVTGLAETLGQETGNDVFKLGQGGNRADGELGDDIFIDNFGDDLYTGSAGFDWVTYADHTEAVSVNLGLIPPVVAPAVPQGDGFDANVESASGSRFNDTIFGDSRTDLRPVLAGVALNPLDNQLRRLLNADGSDLVRGLWSGTGSVFTAGLLAKNDLFVTEGANRNLAFGNLLMGGGGDDSIQGNGGNDVIDGDAALKVQIEWRPSADTATWRRFDSLGQIQDALANGVINPGDLYTVRDIVKEAGTADEAVFRGAFREYDIEGITWSGRSGFLNLIDNNVARTGTTGLRGVAQDLDGDGYIRISHNANFVNGGAAGATFDGVDYVRNVESLRFLNITGAAGVDGVDQILSAAAGFTGTGTATTNNAVTAVRLNPVQSADIVSGFNAATTSLAVAANQRLNFAQTTGQGANFINTFTPIESVGSTALDTDQNGCIWLRNTATVARIKLTYQGQQVTASQFPGWTFAGVQAVAGGYEVALKNADGTYGTWNVNAQGAYVSGQSLSATAIVDKEAAFGQDLDGDTKIGPVFTAIEAVGSTSLLTDQKGRLWLNDGGSEIRVVAQGAQVSATQFPGVEFLAARSLGAGAGFELALKTANGSYGSWTLDANGLYVSGQSLTAAQMVDKEADFGQDLTGDSVIGAVSTAVFNARTLNGPGLNVDNVGRLRISEAGQEVMLKYNGADVSQSAFAGWTAMGIAPVDGSTENTVLWRSDSGAYGTWQVDASGTYKASKVLSSFEVASLESTFGMDLNANGFIGSYLGQDAGGYTLGQGVTLKLGGSQMGPNSLPGWSAVGAAATANGNQVAWRNASNGSFGVWSTDANGNYVAGSATTANNVQIGAYESLFAEDLNGNKVIDVLRTVESFGGASVSVDLAGGYVLGSDKGVQVLRYNGAQITENFGGSWNVVGANDTVTGYQVVIKNAVSGATAYWNTNANGDIVSGKIIDANQVKAFETSFQQDLDGSGTGVADGLTGQMVDPLTPVETAGTASLYQQDNGAYVIDGANGIQFLSYEGNQVTPATVNGWTLNSIEAQGSGYAASWTQTVGLQKATWTTSSTGDFLSASLG